ncbi:MAG: type II toxin-antitoxin system MqsA family antitoxin, partial [Candidatus Accumulibacter sp.]|nr:type II toxin-antitoxin system MqsA family antitoxin [Accumulibacter sp.]
QLAKAEAAAIRATRKKLGLKQADAGHLFGGGVSAFSEYERGKTRPHKSTVLLLRLLDNHPELLREIRQAA